MKVPILQQGATLLTSFQDDLTDRDVLDLRADLMERIDHTGASSVLMDVSAMDTIDSYQAKMLSDIARMAQILGCSVVLSGIQPKVAISLVELGEVISGMRHALNVEEGIAMLREKAREEGGA